MQLIPTCASGLVVSTLGIESRAEAECPVYLQGLSDSLLRLADRRQRTDATLVYGGMLTVVVLTFLVWRWTLRKGGHHHEPALGMHGERGQPTFASK